MFVFQRLVINTINTADERWILGWKKSGPVNTIRFHVVSEIWVTPEENEAQ